MPRNNLETTKQNHRSVPSSPTKHHHPLNTSSINHPSELHSNLHHASTKKLETYNVFNEKHKFLYTPTSPLHDQTTKPLRPLAKASSNHPKKEQMLFRTYENSSTPKDNQSTEVSRNSKDFIENMPKHTLFYCTHCFQFIFDIEKKRHYPQCQDAVLVTNRESSEFYAMTQRKLNSIVELANYTNTKRSEIRKLYDSAVSQTWEKIEKVKYPSSYEFFKLEQIEMAFAYTCNTLLKGVKRKAEPSLFSCF